MGNTSNSESKRIGTDKKNGSTFSEIYTSTKISIPNEKRDDDIAEDQISIIELFISPSKDVCIVILKEKTFTGDCRPIYFIRIYYYDAPQNRFVTVLNHTITDEIGRIDAAVYDPHHNYILLYSARKDTAHALPKFFLFKFQFMTSSNPRLGMNGYDMTKLLHPHIANFGKCRYGMSLRPKNTKCVEIVAMAQRRS